METLENSGELCHESLQFRDLTLILLLEGLGGFDEDGNDILVGDGFVAVAVCVDEFGQNLLHLLSDEPNLLAIGVGLDFCLPFWYYIFVLLDSLVGRTADSGSADPRFEPWSGSYFPLYNAPVPSTA